jgi:Rap1a immunity proteins
LKAASLLASILCVCVFTTGQIARVDPYFAEKHVSLIDGARLYGWCKATAELVQASPESDKTLVFPVGRPGQDAAWCYGYVSAIVDSMPLEKGYFAPSPKVRLTQYVAVVTPYLHYHPQLWHQPAAGAVHIALRQEFSGAPSNSRFAERRISLIDGARLYGWCKATESVQASPASDNTVIFPVSEAGQDAAWCYGYVSAIADSMPLKKSYFAPDPKVQLTQYVAVATLYLHNHPELWDQPAADLVDIALHQEFKLCRHC